ncbi:MAG: ABC transporter permease [Oscillospiraceae bacterium]|nr:ABC transporter permease [Oscillospiraceae bacterium]
MRRNNFSYFLVEGWHGIRSHAFMSFAAIGIITACLLIMGSFSLVAVNMSYNLGMLVEENQFLAYVDDSLTDEEARALQGQVEAVPNVSTVTFITREEAMTAFLEDKEDNHLFQELPASVLRHRYAIHVDDIEQMAATVEAVKQVPGIGGTSAALEIAEGFVTLSNIASAIAFILIAILLVVSLFIISNTIRLATFNRREEIAIMKMCGATDSFVQIPFVVEGVILGLVGAAVSFLLQWGIYEVIVKAVNESGRVQLITLMSFQTLASQVLAIFLFTGLAVGVGGSLLTIRKFLQV